VEMNVSHLCVPSLVPLSFEWESCCLRLVPDPGTQGLRFGSVVQ
jgi:hypothetical protein